MKVVSYKPIGKHQAYDLEVNHPDHQFYLANGLLTSNSHAVSYAIDSYMCAWLLTHFEPEWLCAYMETQSETPDKRASAINELRAFSYEIVKVDVNYATTSWTIIPGKKFMPSLLTVKSIGLAAINEIEQKRPYKNVYDLLWNEDGSWKHSKFNKRALSNLIKIGAFDSMGMVGPGKMFSSYKHMHHVIIENNAKLKSKKKGRDNFEEILAESYDMEPWSTDEIVSMSKELVGSADLSLLMSETLRKRLEEINLQTVDDFAAAEDKKKGMAWFILDEATPKKSRTGSTYLLLRALGPSGKTHRIYCWGWDPDNGNEIKLNVPYVAKLSRWDGGLSTRMTELRIMAERKNDTK